MYNQGIRGMKKRSNMKIVLTDVIALAVFLGGIYGVINCHKSESNDVRSSAHKKAAAYATVLIGGMLFSHNRRNQR